MNRIEEIEAELSQVRDERLQGDNLGSWWTWTKEEFTSWCDTNLMTDLEIDGTNLTAKLKNNLKANNLFTRKAGLLLIVARNIVKWLIRNIL